jgi:RND family efflux transporter MFP subunit
MTRHNLLFVRAAVVAAASLAITSCGEPSGRAPEQRPIAVRVTRPLVTDLESRLSYVGTIHSVREIPVIAQIQGTVAALPIPEGGTVRPGDLLLEIDAPDMRAAVDRVRSERDYWHGHHDANLRLVGAGAIPQEQVNVSNRAYRAAQASLSEAEARLEKGMERSPVHGTVLSWLVETGQHVMPGQPVLILGGTDRGVHVEVVQEDLARGIRVGTRAVVSVRTGEASTSTITDVSPKSSGLARTFTVKLPLPASLDLRWGSSVRSDFILDSRNACTAVPLEALIRRNGADGVFLVRDSRAIWQEVSRGIEQDALVEVTFPWNGEDPVALSNLGSLEDGTSVYPVNDKEARP